MIEDDINKYIFYICTYVIVGQDDSTFLLFVIFSRLTTSVFSLLAAARFVFLGIVCVDFFWKEYCNEISQPVAATYLNSNLRLFDDLNLLVNAFSYSPMERH